MRRNTSFDEVPPKRGGILFATLASKSSGMPQEGMTAKHYDVIIVCESCQAQSEIKQNEIQVKKGQLKMIKSRSDTITAAECEWVRDFLGIQHSSLSISTTKSRIFLHGMCPISHRCNVPRFEKKPRFGKGALETIIHPPFCRHVRRRQCNTGSKKKTCFFLKKTVASNASLGSTPCLQGFACTGVSSQTDPRRIMRRDKKYTFHLGQVACFHRLDG